MSILSNLFNSGETIKSVSNTVDELFTSDEERLTLEHEIQKAEKDFNQHIAQMESSLLANQIQTNTAEVKTGSLFIAGWRPAIGWIGALCLFYNFVIFPLLRIKYDLPQPIDADMLWTIIAGMLGIGGMRSFDKYTGKDTAFIKDRFNRSVKNQH